MMHWPRLKRKGELEAAISKAVVCFEKECMGRGPLEVKTFLLEDIVLVRLKGALTRGEMKLAQEDPNPRGRYLLKQMRQELLERGRQQLEEVIEELLGVGVQSLHADISTRTGERIIVFTLKSKPSYLPEHAVHDFDPSHEP